MIEVPFLLEGIVLPESYPGYKGGQNKGGQNLSTYRARIRMDHDGRLLDDGWLSFDIERRYTWDDNYQITAYFYSMMIDGYYPKSRLAFLGRKSRPTREEFVEKAAELEGFVLDEDRTNELNNLVEYRHPTNNLFVNYLGISRISKGRICIGVIQREPISQLEIVTDKIVPYAVSIFNSLSPTWQISPEVVAESVRIARQSNQTVPVCRIKT